MRVLLTGYEFHQYSEFVGKAFQELGCEVKILPFIDGLKGLKEAIKYTEIKKMRSYLGREFDKERLVVEVGKSRFRGFNKRLILEVDEYKPDILFVIKGNIIYPETLRKIKAKNKGIKIILWMMDSALRFSIVLEGARYYDLFYTYEPADIPQLRDMGIKKARLLHMAFDPDVYKRFAEKREYIDIIFVGGVSGYPNRELIFNALTPFFKQKKLKVAIYGKQWSMYNPFKLYKYKIKKKELGKLINNFNINHNQINEVYNSAKICLNLPDFEAEEAITPRTFEILGAGGFQIADYKNSLKDFFEIDKEIVCFKNIDELKQKISYYLENDKERKAIAEAGHKAVTKHTFKHRIEKILKDTKESNN